jgi:hypothetical protein
MAWPSHCGDGMKCSCNHTGCFCVAEVEHGGQICAECMADEHKPKEPVVVNDPKWSEIEDA